NCNRYGKADWCGHTDPVSCDIPSKRSGCHWDSNPGEQQQLKYEMMHPELPIRPEHSKSRSGYEIVQHPSNGTGNLSDDRLGSIGVDDVLATQEVISRRDLPIRPAHSDGPRSDVRRFNSERTECELSVPKRTSSF